MLQYDAPAAPQVGVPEQNKRALAQGPLGKIVHRAEKAPRYLLDVTGKRPTQALENLRQELMPRLRRSLQSLLAFSEAFERDPDMKRDWAGNALLTAIFGSCPRTKASTLSGIRHWIKYVVTISSVDEAATRAFPPKLVDVIGWSHTLR